MLLMYPLEWPMSKTAQANTLAYYTRITDPSGPAMTDSAHGVIAAQIGSGATYTYLERSIKPFVRGPFALFSEARGDKAGEGDPHAGTPAQDFLTGKGGFLQVFTHGLTGLRLRADRIHLDPMLPPELAGGVTLHNLSWQGRTYDVEIGDEATTVTLKSGRPMTIDTPQGALTISDGAPAVLKTRHPLPRTRDQCLSVHGHPPHLIHREPNSYYPLTNPAATEQHDPKRPRLLRHRLACPKLTKLGDT